MRSGARWPWMVPEFLVACSVAKIGFELFSSVHLHVWSSFSEADAGAWVKQRNPTVSTTSIWLLLVVAQSCLTPRNPMDCSMPGFPVLSYLPEFAQTHVH